MVLKSFQLVVSPGCVLLLLNYCAYAQRNEEVRPAAANVSNESAAGAELFSNEAIQLTNSILAELKNHNGLAQYAPLFAFSNDSNSNEESSEDAGDCRTYPGDPLWPSADLWNVYDDLLGNALSPIIPIASPCYRDSVYDNYDASLCASVTKGWVEESTQLVAYIFPRWVLSRLTGQQLREPRFSDVAPI